MYGHVASGGGKGRRAERPSWRWRGATVWLAGAMAVALVGSVAASYLGARRARWLVIQGQGDSLFRDLLHQAGHPPSESGIASFVAQHAADGVVYAGIQTPFGWLEAGDVSAAERPARLMSRKDAITPLANGRIRLVRRLPPPGGPRGRPPGPGPRPRPPESHFDHPRRPPTGHVNGPGHDAPGPLFDHPRRGRRPTVGDFARPDRSPGPPFDHSRRGRRPPAGGFARPDRRSPEPPFDHSRRGRRLKGDVSRPGQGAPGARFDNPLLVRRPPESRPDDGPPGYGRPRAPPRPLHSPLGPPDDRDGWDARMGRSTTAASLQSFRPVRPPERRRGRPHPFMAIDFRPSIADGLARTAGISLLLGLAAAALFLALGLALQRAASNERLLLVRAERDRRLAAIGEMSAVIAHEIRNPLTSLKGHALLLQEALPEGRAHDKANRVVEETERLEALTTDLLSFVRSGTLTRRSVDPASIVRAAMESVGVARATLDTVNAPRTWLLDPDRLRQALENILKNAAQASESDAPPVEISIHVDGSWLVYVVRDHGPGIPEAQLSQVFEAFHTTRTRGTGLGLAIAERVVQQHGGSIEARNHPDGGAVFTIRVPASAEVS